MSESLDLRRILSQWPYDPENDARIVPGDDGRQILQVRTPVGIEQYELDGRPDGARPYGTESCLEHFLHKLEQKRVAGKQDDFELSPSECGELFNEGTLYYFRYVRLFQLRDWGRTIRDTARNLRVFDLVRRYGHREEDQLFLEKWRPYVLRVNGAAGAMAALDKRDHDAALEIIRATIGKIEALEELEDETFKFERERSLMALREMAEQVQRDRPLTELEQLERQLRRAIDRQEFERAAQLRDRIKLLKKHPA